MKQFRVNPGARHLLRLAVVGTVAGLSACSQPSVTLKDPQSGTLVACKASDLAGGGITSRSVVDQLMTRCVDDYTNRGYIIVASTQP